MSNDTNPSASIPKAAPAPVEGTPNMVKEIGGTTFDVYFHFSRTGRETFTDKVLRLIQAETVTSKK